MAAPAPRDGPRVTGHDVEAARLPAGFSRKEAHQVRRLGLVLAITAAFVVLELAGAVLARSQVLLADGLHLLLDVLALGLSMAAMRVAVRPPSDRFTFGLRRVEPLVALFNGLLVVVVACVITREALEDLASPASPRPTVMLVVAAAALVVHGVSAWLIHDAIGHREPAAHAHEHDEAHDHAHDDHHHGHALNLRGVWLHLVGDVLGSITALVAAIVIGLGGTPRVDAAGSLLVALILVAGAGKLLRDAVLVLLDAAPAHLPTRAVRDLVRSEPGVLEVAELRVWTLGAGHDAVMVKVRVAAPDAELTKRLGDRLRRELGIELAVVEVAH